MARFLNLMKVETTHTRLESILERSFELSPKRINVTGASSALSLAFFFAQTFSKNINGLPHLVVTPSLADAQLLKSLIQYFNPNKSAEILPAFDVSAYSGLYPNPAITSSRVRFLSKASTAKPGELFIAPSDALMQKTLPLEVLRKFSLSIAEGFEFSSNISEFLTALGYVAAPMVEDRGQFALRGGIIDIFAPSEDHPVRIELFGDQVESLRFFSIQDQRSLNEINSFLLTPAKEVLFQDETHQLLLRKVRESFENRDIDKAEGEELIRSLVLKNYVNGVEYLLPYFYERLSNPIDFFSTPPNIWHLDALEILRQADDFWIELKRDYGSSDSQTIYPTLESLYTSFENIELHSDSRLISFSALEYFDSDEDTDIDYRTSLTQDFSKLALAHPLHSDDWIHAAASKLQRWKEDGYRIFICARSQSHADRTRLVLEKMNFTGQILPTDELLWDTWIHQQSEEADTIYILTKPIDGPGLRFDEELLLFLKDDDFLGTKKRASHTSAPKDFQKKAKRLSFGDLKPGDLVAHVKHGIGRYEGLKIMNIGGIESEYIQISYKENDKLYLPVYRVSQLQKYSGPNTSILDKLGGTAWEKTKSKVRDHVRDIAADLLALYAKRAEMYRPPFEFKESEVELFENSFPYEETDDQLNAINDITRDLKSTKPMDRLICGDVGFGKTEVAMRAAFLAVQAHKQVAVLAPTTVLTFQHFETFKQRFKDWPVEIRLLNRFVSTAEAKKTVEDLKTGKVDIVIGTHRLLGSTINFKNLGLLLIDEEHKFGVAHKEKIRKLKVSVDTLAMSATPIPRTLNMALAGIRDLSLINTAPVDRLPTRTFVTKFDEETIRKAITAEISRGGQVYFIHNRIESIYGLADEIRSIVPEARIRVGHGQMDEKELEKTMLAFFNHEIDVLVCTTIVESGMDIPRANTMFIDSAHMLGLSQLYQLRGRVGRSKTRAYCYLIMPRNKKLDKDQQERLKVIQENSALGSGIAIAQYDLEMRGSGNILGEDQSGHINAVGYEMYMDLLNEALAEARGEEVDKSDVDPEINLKIPAMIPENYIPDIRMRLSYYKALADIESAEELDRIEEELRDQFGELPEATVNLMGLMLIRRQCKELGIRDISAGLKSVSLIFTEYTKLPIEKVIQLAVKESQKYSLTPDNRLNIRLPSLAWHAVYDELNGLMRLLP